MQAEARRRRSGSVLPLQRRGLVRQRPGSPLGGRGGRPRLPRHFPALGASLGPAPGAKNKPQGLGRRVLQARTDERKLEPARPSTLGQGGGSKGNFVPPSSPRVKHGQDSPVGRALLQSTPPPSGRHGTGSNLATGTGGGRTNGHDLNKCDRCRKSEQNCSRGVLLCAAVSSPTRTDATRRCTVVVFVFGSLGSVSFGVFLRLQSFNGWRRRACTRARQEMKVVLQKKEVTKRMNGWESGLWPAKT